MSRLMVQLAGAGVVMGLATLTACGSSGSSSTEESPAPRRSSPTASTTPAEAGTVEGVSLGVSGRVAPEPALRSGQPPVTKSTGASSGLLVTYSVRNDRSSPVVVVDRLADGSNAMRLSDQPDPLRVVVRPGPTGVLDLLKQAFPEGSDGLDYTASTQASVVAPGATLRGRAFLPFPLEDHSPPDPFPTGATTWRLCLGVLTTTAGFPANQDGSVVLVPNAPLDEAHRQTVVCSDPAPLPDGWSSAA